MGTITQTVDCADKVPLHILLIGKTGHGKSAAGNSILGRMEFKESSQTKSQTKEVKVAWAEHDLYDIKVIDGPGLEDTDLTQTEDTQKACENMAKALLMCNGGVNVFVLVIRFGMRFTREERKAFSDLKLMFGVNCLKDHGIVVVTYGDQFQLQIEREGKPDKSFKEWLDEQTEDLFKEFSPRIVLFNNVTKSEEEKESQRNELFQHAEKISREKGLYTNEHFSRYADLRAEMQGSAPLLKESIQKKIHLLKAELGRLSEKSTLNDFEHLTTRVDDLLKEIQDQDQSEETLRQLTDVLETIKNIIQELERAVKEENSIMIKVHLDNLKKQKKRLKEPIKIPWDIVIGVIGVCIASGGMAAAGVVFVSGSLLAPIAFRVLTFLGRTLIPMGSALFSFSASGLAKKVKAQFEKLKHRKKE